MTSLMFMNSESLSPADSTASYAATGFWQSQNVPPDAGYGPLLSSRERFPRRKSINQHQHRRILGRLRHVLKFLIRRVRRFELGPEQGSEQGSCTRMPE